MEFRRDGTVPSPTEYLEVRRVARAPPLRVGDCAIVAGSARSVAAFSPPPPPCTMHMLDDVWLPIQGRLRLTAHDWRAPEALERDRVALRAVEPLLRARAAREASNCTVLLALRNAEAAYASDMARVLHSADVVAIAHGATRSDVWALVSADGARPDSMLRAFARATGISLSWEEVHDVVEDHVAQGEVLLIDGRGERVSLCIARAPRARDGS
jgi:hypothetical protein